MDQEQQSSWRPTRRQLLWAGGIAALAFLTIVICGYLFGWKWTGLPKRTLWDWLQLLIIPAVLAGGGLWFNRQQREQELETADRRAQDEALQAYLDQMSDMLIPPSKDLPSLYKARPGDSLSSVARARTLTVLPRLDGDRKARVVQFLYESGLITKGRAIVDLKGADLSQVDLRRAFLIVVDLSEVNLSGADLYDSRLGDASLRMANLSEADLSSAGLVGVNLVAANLHGANLSGAGLPGAYLNEADLSGTDLTDAYVSEVQLDQAESLEGATMPDGQILKSPRTPDGPTFDEWLKSKGSGEDGENSGPR